MLLSDNVDKLKQIDTKYSLLLNKLNIFTVKDLLTYFPRKYSDSSDVITIKELILNADDEETYTLRVRVKTFKNNYIRGKMSLQKAVFVDESGEISATWFNQPYLKDVLKLDKEFLLSGKLKIKPRSYELIPKMYEPVLEGRESIHLGRISPDYPLTQGLSKKWFRNRIKNLIDQINKLDIKDEIKDYKIRDYRINELLSQVHFPENSDSLTSSVEKLSEYELTNIQLKLIQRRAERGVISPPTIDKKIKVELIKEKFIKTIPFKLTSDQNDIVNKLIEKLNKRELLNELIQGDVGSGKTIIAVIASLIITKLGHQVVILSPTTILASQHYETFSKFLKAYKEITIELVTGDTKTTEPKDILIGTSAILARKSNIINDIGLVVVDEQHRFGVQQREELLVPFQEMLSNKSYPHFINMSATPIPRTVAQALFGDINIEYIKSKPIGRLPIKTHLVSPNKRKESYKWIQEEVQKNGSQVYWVCPLVNESEVLNILSVEEVYKDLKEKMPDLRIAFLHGQIKEKEKIKILEEFANHETDILVSTTVIEVGIDVSNASIMVIENSERFGLAQLHQIRGRVGRSNKQSWCFLFYDKEISESARERIEFLCINHDGLKIAEYDLQVRGPGEVYGYRQSGIPELKIAKLNNLDIIRQSKDNAEKLYKLGVKEISLFS